MWIGYPEEPTRNECMEGRSQVLHSLLLIGASSRGICIRMKKLCHEAKHILGIFSHCCYVFRLPYHLISSPSPMIHIQTPKRHPQAVYVQTNKSTTSVPSNLAIYAKKRKKRRDMQMQNVQNRNANASKSRSIRDETSRSLHRS